MSDQDQAELRLRLAKLKQDHEDFDAAIEAMIAVGRPTLQIQRMKKKKLAIKDLMTRLEDQVLPDIIA
ncbi:MAG: YdcH family protein [Pseudomonadota bacterium]